MHPHNPTTRLASAFSHSLGQVQTLLRLSGAPESAIFNPELPAGRTEIL